VSQVVTQLASYLQIAALAFMLLGNRVRSSFCVTMPRSLFRKRDHVIHWVILLESSLVTEPPSPDVGYRLCKDLGM
jgi:hypothetical protein